MESSVSSKITSHIATHNFSNPQQQAYKEGHFTELLLVKMTDDWRRALANNETVRIVFVDFKKSVPFHIHLGYFKSYKAPGTFGCEWRIRQYTVLILTFSTLWEQMQKEGPFYWAVLQQGKRRCFQQAIWPTETNTKTQEKVSRSNCRLRR